jgi:predicted N-acyltransferase
MQIVHQLNHADWRAFVDTHPQGNIFHTPEMFEAYAQAKGHHPELWASVNDSGDILALFIPVQITLFGGPLRSFTSRAVVYGSALCLPGQEGKDALTFLLKEYNQATRSSLLFTEMRNLTDLTEVRSTLDAQGFLFEEHLNFLISLDVPEEELWKCIRSNARRNIQKARKMNVEVTAVTDEAEIPESIAVLKDVYRRIQVPLPDQSLFEAVFRLLQPKGMVRVLAARVEKKIVGVLFLLLYKDIVYYWYTGTLREYSLYRTHDLLVWEALEFGNRNHFRMFDFGGGGKPDEEYGVRDFKAKFGGTLVNYGRHLKVHSPLRLKLSREGYQLMRRFL